MGFLSNWLLLLALYWTICSLHVLAWGLFLHPCLWANCCIAVDWWHVHALRGWGDRDIFACVHMLFSVVSLFNVFVFPFGIAFGKKMCLAFRTFFVEFLSRCKVHNTLQTWILTGLPFVSAMVGYITAGPRQLPVSWRPWCIHTNCGISKRMVYEWW